MAKRVMPRSNGDVDWDCFCPSDYNSHNYARLQEEDKEILGIVGAFFAQAFSERRPGGAEGPPPSRAIDAIDVGSGANLYPALLMLPWAKQILLTDHSVPNVEWLSQAVADGDGAWAWQEFWEQLQGLEGYSEIDAPRKQLQEACADRVMQHSVFSLPERQWQLGTMFFVAESITRRRREFRLAIARFIGALQADAPFAIAFMAGSRRYKVAGIWFPAVPVTERKVSRLLRRLSVDQLTVLKTRTPPQIRKGYKGMIVATGRVSGRG